MEPMEIAQVGYATRNLDQSVKKCLALGGTGPFYVGEFELMNIHYRGQPVNYPKLRVAFAYQGALQVEFIQVPDEKSFYGELLGDREEGVHHTFSGTQDYDKAVAGYVSAGCQEVFCSDSTAPHRLTFVDTVPLLGHFVELIDFETVSPTLLIMYQKMKDATLNWDGRDPIRKLSDLL